MRIEVLAGTGGSIGTLQKSLDSLNNDILETIQALQSINYQLDNLNGGALTSAVESVNARIHTENVKIDSLNAVSRQLDIFVETIIEKDQMVAHSIWQGQKKFFDEYEWLRPVVKEERTWWEQLCSSWNDFWNNAGEMLGNAWNDICEFVGDRILEMVAGMAVITTAIWEKSTEILQEAWDAIVSFVNEHWVELLVGTIGIIVGTVLLVLSGGTLLAALAIVGKIVVSSMVASTAINMAFAALTGGDLLEAMVDGIASGYMWGGIMAAVAGIGTAINTIRANVGLNSSDPNYIANKLLDNGTTTERTLKKAIPKGTQNNFKPTDSIKAGYKYNFEVNGTKIEIKWHSADLNAGKIYPGCNSGKGWTAQIKVGKKNLGINGKYYRKPNNLTHIPIIKK